MVHQADRAVLAGLRVSRQYEVLLDIMERELTKMETEHFRTDIADEERILATFHECHAARLFFERLQAQVNFEVAESTQEEITQDAT